MSVLLDEARRSRPDTFAMHASGGRWLRYRWLEYLAERLAEGIYRGGARLIVNVAPRFGKSEFISHWCPTWFLDRWPDRRVIMASYGDQLASHWGRMVRDEVAGNPFVRVSLKEDSKAAGIWHTPQNGGMISVGVGGPILGFGGDLLICDDPHKNWEEAHSYAARTKLVDWWNSTFLTRAEPGASIIVLLARWHEDDLTGYLVERGGWEVIRLPALAEPDDPLGRAEGEPLCPERYRLKALEHKRREVGDQVWAACFQQAPLALSSGRVFRNFLSARNVDPDVPLDHELPLALALDFNINPGMHGLVCQWDPRADEFRVVHEIHGPRMDILACLDAFASYLADVGGPARWRELHVFGDSTGNSEWVGTSQSCYSIVYRRLRAMGIRLLRRRVPRKNPPIADSVAAMNDALCDVDGKMHLRIHPKCERLIRDLREMRADESGAMDKRDNSLSHSADACRYMVSYLRPLTALRVINPNRQPEVGGRWSVAVHRRD